MEALRIEIAKDNLRILDFLQPKPNVVQFYLSSQPQTSPSEIIRSVKGRWQHLSRQTDPFEFRRNYRITSVGDAKCEVLNTYVAKQSAKHPMADSRAQAVLETLQYHDPTIDPKAVRRSSYGEYIHSLQIVIESDSGWHEIRQEVLAAYQRSIIAGCRRHDWRLSRIGLLSNHLHILLAAGIADSPQSVVLSLMNNLAYSQEMKAIWRFSYYAGTFGPYDRGAIWNSLS